MNDQLKIKQAILHITYACTHHCPMCYANAGNNINHPPIEKLYHVADKLINMGIKDITFVGGDPALYPEILELARYFKLNNIHLSILSNTLDFNANQDDILKYIDVFEGTIHHNISEEHDKFCGCDGAYKKLINNMEFFSSHNKSVGIAINLIPFNYNVIYDIISEVIANNINLDHIVLQRIIQFGRATGSYKYELSDEMVDRIMYQVEKAKKDFNVKVIFEDPFPMCSVEEKYRKYMHPCEWGITKVSVDYNGNLSRCGADVFNSLGTVFDDDIIKKWNTNDTLNNFRAKNYLPSKCISCKYINTCGGGCPISRNPEIGFTRDYLAK